MDLMALVIYKGVARSVLLPISSEELAELFGYEDQDIEFTVASIEGLPDLDCEGLTLDLANKLAENLEDIDDDLVLSFIEVQSSNPKYLAIFDFDQCELLRDVFTDYDLGLFYVKDMGIDLSERNLQNYFDYEKYGQDVRLEEWGFFVKSGYFVLR